MGFQVSAFPDTQKILELFPTMSGYNWTWPQIPSLTAMKYQRHGYVERKPFEIGERHSGRRDLEKYVKGYRQLRRDLDRAREELLLSTQLQSPHLLKDNFFKVQFYKPVVAAKTNKVGGTYRSKSVGRIGFFLHH